MKQQFTITIPSKTFLSGEYAILNGGRAVVMSHSPSFQISVNASAESELIGIHPQSPAGQYVRKNGAAFKNWRVEFFDPYLSAGGFGASSAQFVGCFAWKHFIENLGTPNSWNVNVETLWRAFRDLSFEGNLPSGGDVIAQAQGGVSIVKTTPYVASCRPWPFLDLEALIVPTGFKVSTFEHLRERLPVTDELMNRSEEAAQSFVAGDSENFLRHLQQFADELERLSLVTASTRGLIAQISAIPEVLLVKGCGALGADVILVLVRPENSELVRGRLTGQGLIVRANSRQLGEGLKLEVKLAPEMSRGEAESWV